MKTLITLIVLLFVSSGVSMAYEDCTKIKNGDSGDSIFFDDQGIARQTCRVANALEMILEEMRKK